MRHRHRKLPRHEKRGPDRILHPRKTSPKVAALTLSFYERQAPRKTRGVDSPAGVSNFTVERSYDGEFYDHINQVSSNNAVRFTWKDEGVYKGMMYYRVICNMNVWTSHYSGVETIRIVKRLLNLCNITDPPHLLFSVAECERFVVFKFCL